MEESFRLNGKSSKSDDSNHKMLGIKYEKCFRVIPNVFSLSQNFLLSPKESEEERQRERKERDKERERESGFFESTFSILIIVMISHAVGMGGVE